MKPNLEFDRRIRRVLVEKAQEITPDPLLKHRIEEAINEQTGGQSMKRYKWKRMGVGLAAALFLVTGGALAASGTVAGWISGSSPQRDVSDYSQINRVIEKAGMDSATVVTLENFSNGFAFLSLNPHESKALDDQGKVMYAIPTLTVQYTQQEGEALTLFIKKPLEEEADPKTPDQVRQVGDTSLRYDVYTQKTVPSEYELTQEDLVNQEREDFFLSYGSDQVEVSQLQFVSWEKDGYTYQLMGTDVPLTGEELLDMAEEYLERGE